MSQLDDYAAVLPQFVPSPVRYMRYLDLVFQHADPNGRAVLDVGGGNGLLSFYAAARGATRVVCLDPGGDGSSPAIAEQFEMMQARLGGNVERLEERFQDHDPGGDRYGVVLVHNAINHLDEDACARLPAPDATAAYTAIFAALRNLLQPGGRIVVADCGRRNFWGDLHLHNVFNPTIEWDIHQQPQVWNDLMVRAGFQSGRVIWDAPSKLRRPGQALLGNRLGGYLTNSHFILTAQA